MRQELFGEEINVEDQGLAKLAVNRWIGEIGIRRSSRLRGDFQNTCNSTFTFRGSLGAFIGDR